MDSSSAQHQAMGTHSLEDVIACAKPQQDQRRLIRPQPEQLKCPRCDSANTKFCYYNNYSLSQPRYFCKACRRYWTKGGSLRNVPVGGGCRKNNKRSSSSSSGKRSSSQEVLSTNSNPLPSLFPSLSYDTNDLTLAFGNLHKQPSRQLRLDDHGNSILGNLNTTHFDHIIGNPNTTANTNAGYAGGYLETPNGYLHNFYYGYGNGNMGEVDQGCGGSGSHEEMVLPYEDTSAGATTTATTTTAATITTTTKQEFYNGSRDGENRMFLNFPWQFNGEGNMENVDSSGRECWNNGIGSSSWHGLVNSSLM